MSNTQTGLTAHDILKIQVGSRLSFNFDVHVVTGPNPATWNTPVTVSQIVTRGGTDPIHPRGGGHPWVVFRYPLGDDAWIQTSAGVGEQCVRVVD